MNRFSDVYQEIARCMFTYSPTKAAKAKRIYKEELKFCVNPPPCINCDGPVIVFCAKYAFHCSEFGKYVNTRVSEKECEEL